MTTAKSPARALRVAAAIAAFLACAGCSSSDTRPEKPVYYPVPPDPPRIQFLRSISSSDDLAPPSFFKRLVLGARADEDRIALGKPYAAAYRDGKLYVCDAKGALVFDLASKSARLLDPEHPQLTPHPVAIAIADDGMKYLADIIRKVIVVYDKDDNFVTVIGDPTAWKPVGVAVTKDKVYGLDVENYAVQVFDRKTGTRLGGFGGEGNMIWNLNRPNAITTDKDGNVYVTDSFHFRVNKYDAQGRYLRSFGEAGRDFGQFGRPRGISVDHEGRLYVVDASFGAVQIFDKEGRLLLVFGDLGNAPGNLYLPSGIFISYEAVAQLEPYVAKERELEYVIIVVNQFGPNGLSFYGLLKQPSELKSEVAPVSSDSVAPVSTAVSLAGEKKPGASQTDAKKTITVSDVPDEWFSDTERQRRAAAQQQGESKTDAPHATQPKAPEPSAPRPAQPEGGSNPSGRPPEGSRNASQEAPR